MDAPAQIEIARTDRVLAEAPADHATWLSDSERARLAELRHAGRRAHYLAGHWLARVLLARAYGRDAAQWRLLERRGLPPQVDDEEAEVGGIRISIAHSADWIAAAVAPIAIGIDLEHRGRRLDDAIEPLLRNADEPPGSLDPDERLQRWVAKEAWLKRRADSALPARLAQLQLRPANPAAETVRLDSHAEFHFGVALASGYAVQLRCEVPLTRRRGFSVIDGEHGGGRLSRTGWADSLESAP